MQHKAILIILLLFCFSRIIAQAPVTGTEADEKSLQLYNAAQWPELLQYGKTALSNGIDFPLLRMRTAYSAFMLGNFSQSLQQYEKVLLKDPSNNIALYYCYLNNLYLNNISASRYYAAKLSTATKETEKLKSTSLSSVEAEYSFKRPDDPSRGDAQYARAGATFNAGYRLQLHVSGALYNQKISEPGYLYVTSNTKIDIRQKEAYGKFIFGATGRLSVIGAYHYLYTPFNNFIYHNQIGFAALNLTTPYAHFQAAANIGRLGDSSFSQFDGTVTAYPLGNLNLYTISRISVGDDVTFSQVAGLNVVKGIWIEANAVFGTYRTLLENDAMYVYNDIDTKKMKAGASVYVSLIKHLTVSINYTFEQKEKIFTLTKFTQQSIIGGIKWTL